MDLRIFVDAAFDSDRRIGCYCVVTIFKQHKDWYVEEVSHYSSSNDAERAGIHAALDICEKVGRPAAIYCDNQDAIRKCQLRAKHQGCEILYFKGHQLGSQDVPIDDDVKYHHWADRMAVGHLRRHIDERKTRAYNEGEKET